MLETYKYSKLIEIKTNKIKYIVTNCNNKIYKLAP
jgi:hypothetical protein